MLRAPMALAFLLALSPLAATVSASATAPAAFDAPMDVEAMTAPAWTPLGSGVQPTSLGRAIVGFEPGQMPSVAVGDDLQGFRVLLSVPKGDFLVLAADDLWPVKAVFQGAPGVAYVEDDPLAFAYATPNDPRYANQYGPGQMGFPTAWGDTPGYGSSSVVVAVLDTGIYRNHADFTPASRFLGGWDYVNNDSNPNDDCGHGTHVTGTVAAATDNKLHVAGMSQASILPMKVLGPIGGLLSVQCSGSHSIIAQAILDAKDEADVISMSLGGSSGSTTLKNAVDSAWKDGVLVVAAAGNDGASNSIDYPAAYPNAIAVGALTSSKVRASYSDMGPELDVMAPGSNVESTSSSGGTTTMSGTSMATPHVAGALALALSCAPSTMTASTLRTKLESTTEDLGAAGFDTTYGNGLVRVDRLVDEVCTGGGSSNTPPVASFTTSTNGLTVTATSTSTDADGDALTLSWSWGDGTAASSGSPASHTYAAAGTYTITLTGSDGKGGSDTETASVTVSSPSDPDPSTPNLQSGTSVSVTVSSGQEAFYKIQVPSGKAQLKVEMSGPSCGLLSCSVDADLYTRLSAKPTDTVYDCRPYTSGNAETCTHTNPVSGWYYVRVKGYSGSGTVSIKATIS